MRIPFLAAVLSTVVSAQNADFRAFGAGCPGTSGEVPNLSALTAPKLGGSFTVALTDAPPNTGAFLVLGISDVMNGALPLPFDLGVLGAPGCRLLCSTEDVSLAVTDGNGDAQITVSIPSAPSLEGAELLTQWIISDRGANNLGLIVSNGGRATLGPLPQLHINPPPAAIMLGEGDRFTLTGTFGNVQPRDLCAMAVDPQAPAGDWTRFRAIAVQPTPVAGQAVVTFEVDAVGQATRPQQISIMRGRDRNQRAMARRFLSRPGFDWSWDGIAFPENVAMNVGTFMPPPDDTPRIYVYSPRVTGGSKPPRLEARFKDENPWNSLEQDWPKRAIIISDFHYNMRCGSGPTKHYDHFLKAVTVVRPDAETKDILDEHALQVEDVLKRKYVGDETVEVTVEWDSGASEYIFRIEPENPDCEIVSGGGKLILKEPSALDTQVAYVHQPGLFGGSDLSVFDPNASVASATLALPDQGHEIVTTLDGDLAILTTVTAAVGTDEIRFVDLSSGTPVIDPTPLTTTFDRPVVATGAGRYAVVAAQGGSTDVSLLDLVTRQFVDTLTLTSSVNVLAMSPTGSAAGDVCVVAGSSSNTDLHNLVVSQATGTIAYGPGGTLARAAATYEIAFNPVGEQVVVATPGQSIDTFFVQPTLQIFPFQTVALTGVPVGFEAESIVFAPDCESLYVLCAHPLPIFVDRHLAKLDVVASTPWSTTLGPVNTVPGTGALWLPSRQALGISDDGDWLILGNSAGADMISTGSLAVVDHSVPAGTAFRCLATRYY